MKKLSMCRICLVQNVRMCVVTNKSLLEMYEKLTGVPFVTEDCKPMLACFFCCTRLKQCCQLQRKCVEAEELLAQMLSEDYEQKPLTNRGHLEFVGGFIITPIENISIVDDCQIGCDAIKQELPAVCEEQDVVELQPAHLSEELDSENMYNSHPDVEAHHSFESEEEQLVMEIKIEKEGLTENLRVRETEKLEQEKLEKSYPGVEDISAHDSQSDSKDDVLLVERKTEAEEGQGVLKRKRRACVTQRAAVAKKPTLRRKLEDTIPDKPSDSKIIRTIKTKAAVAKRPTQKRRLEDTIPAKRTIKIIRTTKTSSTSESVAKIKLPITTTSQITSRKSPNLIEHTRIHTGQNPFKCDICHRSFSNRSNLNRHFRIHPGVKLHKCDVCERSFKSKKYLRVHLRNHTGEKPFKCEVCQRSFSQKSSLNVHSRLHTGEKPYQCDICQRSFVRKSRLTAHFRKHSGEKPFKCDICHSSLSDKSSLKEHFRIHTGEKPYKCDVCQRSFISKSKLTVHFRKHSGEKPFQCDICQRSFSDKSSLNRHFRKHSGEKPYKCDVCQRSFSENGSLTIHSRLHTGEKPYQCNVCKRNFICKGKLTVHFRKHSDE